MKKLLIFAGTTEGRQLALEASHLPLALTVSVATDYGRELLEELPSHVKIRTGRMDEGEMSALFCRESYGLVVDATHPYATEVTGNIRRAAARAGISYQRLLRRESAGAACLTVPDMEGAVEAVKETQGRVLLTTGSKELAAFAALPRAAERLYVRVLPTVEAIGACEALGLHRSHIIAMQGPFTQDLNLATLSQYDISVLVTKDGGEAGGFLEKMLAAEQRGVTAVVVGRPPDQGMSLEELKAVVRRYAEDMP